MNRLLTIENVLNKKYKTFPFEGIFKAVFGLPETSGIWLVYGAEKNGKTWGTLMLVKYISQFTKVLYISAEEGISQAFQNSIKRAGLEPGNRKFHFTDYETIEDIKKRLKARNPPKVVVLDNATIYNEELRGKGIKELKLQFPDVLFIIIAHEERGKPYTACAAMASKLAEVIIRVKGLMMLVSGRVPGGTLTIHKEKALLYHGHESDN